MLHHVGSSVQEVAAIWNFLKEMQMKFFSQNIKEPWEIPAHILITIHPAKAVMLKQNKFPPQNKTRKPWFKQFGAKGI